MMSMHAQCCSGEYSNSTHVYSVLVCSNDRLTDF